MNLKTTALLVVCFTIISAKAQNKKQQKYDIEFPANENLVKVSEKGKWGFTDTAGTVRIPLVFDDVTSFINGMARVLKNGKVALIDTSGKQLTDWFHYIYPFYNGLAKVKKNEQIAFINPFGEIVSEWFEQDFVYYYGLIRVKRNHKWAFINKSGKIVTNWYFNVDTLLTKIKFEIENDSAFILNEKNKEITDRFNATFWQSNYDEPYLLFDSLFTDTLKPILNNSFYTEDLYLSAWAELKQTKPKLNILNINSMPKNKLSIKKGLVLKKGKKGKLAFYDPSGKKVSKSYVRAENFYEGTALVMNKAGKMAILGANAEQITPFYDRIFHYYSNLALIRNNKKYAFADKTGKIVTPWFKYASGFSNGLAKVHYNNKWGFINETGKFVIPPIYDDATSFSYNFARVRLGENEFLINKKGENQQGNFEYAYIFTDSISPVKIGKQFAFINKKGKIITDRFDNATQFTKGIAKVRKNGKTALINNKGELISDWFDAFFIDNNFRVTGENYNVYLEPINYYGSKLYNVFQFPGSFQKYSDNSHYEKQNRIPTNYTDRDYPLRWNHNFFSEGLQTFYKKRRMKKDEKTDNKFKAVALADYDGQIISKWYKMILEPQNGFIIAFYKRQVKNKYKKNKVAKKTYWSVSNSYKYSLIKQKEKNKLVLLDNYGKEISENYTDFYHFNKGVIELYQRKRSQLVNSKGEILTPFYDLIYFKNNGTVYVKKNKKYALLNKKYKQSSDWFDHLNHKFVNNALIVKKNKKWGAISPKGKYILEPIYEQVYFFNKKLYAKLGNKTFLFSNSGEKIKIYD